jgi:alpha-beta hydrolase superfamily lysophospholipase
MYRKEATMPSISPDHRSFVDAHGVTVHYYVWAAAQPRAVIQLAHGLGEYAQRYQELCDFLVANGISVWGNDHRGHGQTGLDQFDGDHARLGHLGVGGLRATIDDIHQFTGIIRDANPGIPLAYLGQSWGSLMGQILINSHASDFNAVVLTGTAHRVPGQMAAGDLNAKHKHLGTTGFEWLSRDTAVSAAFLADPLTFYADVLKLFGLADGLRLFGRPKKLAADVPILIMIGSEDSLGGEKSVSKLAEDYIGRGGLTDVEVVVYPGARHEVFNEINKGEVRDDLLEWLETRLLLTEATAS